MLHSFFWDMVYRHAADSACHRFSNFLRKFLFKLFHENCGLNAEKYIKLLIYFILGVLHIYFRASLTLYPLYDQNRKQRPIQLNICSKSYRLTLLNCILVHIKQIKCTTMKHNNVPQWNSRTHASVHLMYSLCSTHSDV